MKVSSRPSLLMRRPLLTRDMVSSQEQQMILGLIQGPVLMNGLRAIRLFLSSPSDVKDERDAVERAVHRFNQTWLEEKRLFIRVVRWELMAPQIGPAPQTVINKQLLPPIDLFIGVMWNRFGTPTRVSGSGTEEEFEWALSTWQRSGKPWIAFYFCQRPINITTAEQLQEKGRVLEFRERVCSLGTPRDYESVAEFETSLYVDLMSIVTLPEFCQTQAQPMDERLFYRE